MASDRIVGIDLGTTNSLVAFMQGESPVVIPGDDGSNLVPSVVALDEKNQPVIGNAARKYLIATPERAVYSIKRLMGRGVDDVQQELKFFPFRLAEDLQAGEVLRIRLGRENIYPAGNFGPYPAPAQTQRRALLRSASHQSRHHRPRVFQRRSAPSHEGCRPHRRSRSSALGQRTHGCVAGLRPRQEAEWHRCRLRSRRRHFRHLDPQAARWNFRSHRHQRRHASRRRRHRQSADHHRPRRHSAATSASTSAATPRPCKPFAKP